MVFTDSLIRTQRPYLRGNGSVMELMGTAALFGKKATTISDTGKTRSSMGTESMFSKTLALSEKDYGKTTCSLEMKSEHE